MNWKTHRIERRLQKKNTHTHTHNQTTDVNCSHKHTSVGIGLERGNEVIAIARPLTRRSLSSVRRRRRATTDVSALRISWMASSALASACACSSRSSSTSIASSATCGAVVCTICTLVFGWWGRCCANKLQITILLWNLIQKQCDVLL
jgi:hypothetical protein